jgi:glutaredoxin
MEWTQSAEVEEPMPSIARRAAAIAVALVLPAAAQSVYKWTDSQGKVHCSDTPPTEPATGVTQKRVNTAPAENSQVPYAVQMAMKNHPVTLYTAPQCGDPCADGRTLLGDRGIPYTERNAQGSPADAEAVKKLIGALQVPVLVVGDNPLKGYDASAWHAALDTAGYPRTKLPGTLAPKPQIAATPPVQEAPEGTDAAEPPK